MADVVLGISRWVRGAAKEEDMLLLVGARLLIVNKRDDLRKSEENKGYQGFSVVPK